MKNRILFLLFSTVIASFFLFGEASAQSIDPTQTESYLKLDSVKNEQIIKDLLSVLTEKWMDLLTSGYSKAEDEAVIVTVRRGVRAHIIDYFFLELPKQGLVITLKAVIKTASVLISPSRGAELLDEIEDISVDAAKEKVSEWLFQNEIKVGIGELPLSYVAVSEKREKFSIPYVIVFRPKQRGGADVSVSFYSSKPINPPKPIGDPLSGTMNDFWSATDDTLPPFILEIKGEVKELPLSGALFWNGKASIKITYPEYVPELHFEKPSLGERLVKAFVEEFINLQLLVQAGKKILGPLQSITDMVLDKIKWLFPDKGLEESMLTGSFFKELEREAESSDEKLEEENPGQKEKESEEKSMPEPAKEPVKKEVLGKKEENEKVEKRQIICPTSANLTANVNRVVFNEIAWMGTENSSYDEWIELKNISGQIISLEGWQIVDKENQIEVIFQNITLAPGGFLLLERTDDESVPSKKADVIYTGGLSNTGEALYLFNSQCGLEDKIGATDGWPAGDNGAKKTMERTNGLAWQASAEGNGTPKAENSQGWEPEEPEESEDPEEQRDKDSEKEGAQPLEICSIPTRGFAKRNSVIVNEIAWMGTTTSSYDEWIELKNISGETISLKGWQIIDKENQIEVILDRITLSPEGFALFERTDDNSVPSQKADVIYAGGLGNTDEVVYLFNSDCGLEDIAGTESPWPAGDNGTKRTMERADDLTWQTSAVVNGTPKAKNSKGWQGESNGGNGNGGGVGGESGGKTYSPPQILITEVQIEGGQDFVELYNPTNNSQNLKGSKLRKKTKAGSEYSLYSFSEEVSIPAKTYRVWASSKNDYHQEIESHFSTSAYLTQNNSIALLDKNGDSVDKLAWGQGHNSPFLETKAFPSNPETYDPLGEYFSEIGFTGSREPYPSTLYPQTVGRKIENGEYQDTGDNSADFEIQSPTPNGENRAFEAKTIEEILLEIDSTPPTVQITFNPLSETNQEDAKFTFEASEENCIFRCKIDSEDWEECVSPEEYSGLSEGEHIFQVKASDIFQNTSSTVSYSWIIDTNIESAIIILSNKDTGSTLYTNDREVNLIIEKDEGATSYLISEDQGEKPSQDNAEWQNEKQDVFTLSEKEGEKTVYIWTKDALGNISALGNNASIVLDTMPPSSAVIGLEAEQNEAVFTVEWPGNDGESGSGIDSYEIQKKQGENDWTLWYEGNKTSADFTGSDGSTYYFKSRATDKTGNIEDWPETADTSTYVNVSVPNPPSIISPENDAIISPDQDENEIKDDIQITISGTTDAGTNVFVNGNAAEAGAGNDWSFEATLITGLNNFNIWCQEADGDLSEQVVFGLILEPEEMPSGEVVINEIAWMGTEVSHADEWIELYNTTGEDIELEEWTLNAESGSPEIVLTNTISANDFYLLERTNENTVSDILADWIGPFGNGLHNDGENLELRDNEGNLIDKLDCQDEWFAGGNESSATRVTMERINPAESGSDASNWADNNGQIINGIDAGGNPINGTPGQPNSVFQTPKSVTLTISAASADNRVVLEWSAPSDLNSPLIELGYDIRYSFSEITQESWSSAVAVQQDSTLNGNDQTLTLWPLNYDKTYYFGIRVLDQQGHYSEPAFAGPFQTPSSAPAFDWPMFKHDPERTGYVQVQGPTSADNLQAIYDAPVSDIRVGIDNIIYFLSDGSVHAIDPASGYEELWSFADEGSYPTLHHLAVGRDGTIFALSHKLIALDPMGNKMWEYETSNLYADQKLATKDERLYFISGCHYDEEGQGKTMGKLLFAFDLDSNIEWVFQTGNASTSLQTFSDFDFECEPHQASTYGASVLASPAISPDGTVYFGANRYLYALSSSGDLKWRVDFTKGVNMGMPAIDANGIIYVSAISQLWAVDTNKIENNGQTIDPETSDAIQGLTFPDDIDEYAPVITPEYLVSRWHNSNTYTLKYEYNNGLNILSSKFSVLSHVSAPLLGAANGIYLGRKAPHDIQIHSCTANSAANMGKEENIGDIKEIAILKNGALLIAADKLFIIPK